jgi:hypothetical protein
MHPHLIPSSLPGEPAGDSLHEVYSPRISDDVEESGIQVEVRCALSKASQSVPHNALQGRRDKQANREAGRLQRYSLRSLPLKQ